MVQLRFEHAVSPTSNVPFRLARLDRIRYCAGISGTTRPPVPLISQITPTLSIAWTRHIYQCSLRDLFPLGSHRHPRYRRRHCNSAAGTKVSPSLPSPILPLSPSPLISCAHHRSSLLPSLSDGGIRYVRSRHTTAATMLPAAASPIPWAKIGGPSHTFSLLFRLPLSLDLYFPRVIRVSSKL